MPEWSHGSPLPPGWEKMRDDESKQIWRRFGRAFSFRASTHKDQWPGIEERAPSLNYQLPPFKEINQQRVWDTFLSHFKALTVRPGQERMAVLDWQHQCYWLTPAKADSTAVVPIIPNGDYYIFLGQEFRYGTFGHPWEWSLNVFGAPLLERLKAKPSTELGKPLRQR